MGTPFVLQTFEAPGIRRGRFKSEAVPKDRPANASSRHRSNAKPSPSQAGFHFCPGTSLIRVGTMSSGAAFQFLTLSGAERPGIRPITDAVPDLFDQLEPFGHAELADVIH